MRSEICFIQPMKLLTKEIRRQLPALHEQDSLGEEAIAYVKLFTPDAHWSWYAIAFDGEDTFFGFVRGDYPEFGTFSLSELEQLRGGLGLPVERDKFFQPTPLRELMD
jgi:hypothetical protein